VTGTHQLIFRNLHLHLHPLHPHLSSWAMGALVWCAAEANLQSRNIASTDARDIETSSIFLRQSFWIFYSYYLRKTAHTFYYFQYCFYSICFFAPDYSICCPWLVFWPWFLWLNLASASSLRKDYKKCWKSACILRRTSPSLDSSLSTIDGRLVELRVWQFKGSSYQSGLFNFEVSANEATAER
jgi:hypothetical protein